MKSAPLFPVAISPRLRGIRILLISLVCACLSDGKAELPDNNVEYPVLIESEDGGVGSGFFLEAGRKIYLVTASHVLFSPVSGRLKGDYARVSSPSLGQGRPAFGVELDLKQLLNSGLVRAHAEHDVTIVRVGEMDGNSDRAPLTYVPGVEAVDRGMIVAVAGGNTTLSDGVKVSREVFVLGYPKSVGIRELEQVDTRMPLVRRGIVAGKNFNRGAIILDCQVDGGNSGGPVVQVSVDSDGKERFRVIGLVSEFVPTAEEWVNRSHGQVRVNISNSGYSVVVPMDSVWELIAMGRMSLSQRGSHP